MMTDASGTKKCKDEYVCVWCGARFLSPTLQKTPVCQRCYRLLSSAGLKDKEIFAEVKPSEDKDGD